MQSSAKEPSAVKGKKLDMGKSCLRFKKLEDLPLDVIGELIARVPVADYIFRRIGGPTTSPQR